MAAAEPTSVLAHMTQAEPDWAAEPTRQAAAEPTRQAAAR